MERYRSREDAPGDSMQDDLLWPDQRLGPWLIRVTWVDRDGRLECAGVEIRSYQAVEGGQDWPPWLPVRTENPPILTTTTLRKLPFATIVDDLRRGRAAQHIEIIDFLKAQPEYQSERDQAALRQLRSAGTRRHADLPEVAAVYRQARTGGRNPTRAVAEHFTITQSAAAKRVARARQAGYLPLTSRGKPRS